jgi:DNA polymerase III subunit beta
MKVTCQQENLARGLAIVGRAVATRSTLPVLANILLETDESRLKLAATNLEMGINCWIGARVDESGAVTVPARLLSDFVNSLPPTQVAMELDGRNQTLMVSADRYEAEIKGIDAADFPILPTVEQGIRFTVDPATLRAMINQVAVSSATDESRPILTGVLVALDPDAGLMTLAAADGFRLSVRETELTAPLAGRLNIIVPARTLLEVARISADEEQPIEVAITDNHNQILFRLAAVDLVSQLIDGNFPDYQKIMPTSHTTRVVMNTKALHNAVRIASFFARDAANVVRLDVRPGDDLQPGIAVVSAQAAEVGENQSEVEASIHGPGLEIAFNAKYMLDVTNVVGTEQIALELTTASSPGLFRPVDGTNFVHVIMPMHIGR